MSKRSRRKLRMKQLPRRERNGKPARGGFSLVETIVAVLLLSFAILGVTSSGTGVLLQMGRARSDMQLWAGLQTVADSLRSLGMGGVSGGSRTIAGFSFTWTVDSTTNPYDMIMLRGNSPSGGVVVNDSMVIWLN
jgi:type II secretory pathway pseudopilin PulG